MYDVTRFDYDTYVVVEKSTGTEICVCCNYGDKQDAKKRADRVAYCLESVATLEQQGSNRRSAAGNTWNLFILGKQGHSVLPA